MEGDWIYDPDKKIVISDRRVFIKLLDAVFSFFGAKMTDAEGKVSPEWSEALKALGRAADQADTILYPVSDHIDAPDYGGPERRKRADFVGFDGKGAYYRCDSEGQRIDPPYYELRKGDDQYIPPDDRRKESRQYPGMAWKRKDDAVSPLPDPNMACSLHRPDGTCGGYAQIPKNSKCSEVECLVRPKGNRLARIEKMLEELLVKDSGEEESA